MPRDYSSFCSYIKNKSVALIGLGVSNLPLVSFLLKSGAKSVTVRDLKKDEGCKEIIQAKNDGATCRLGEDYLSDLTEDLILRSPGLRPDLPAFCVAKKNGSRITCETELFLEYCPCKTIAVTGSDGKTTTTNLIAIMLRAAGKSVYLGGNLGIAMLPYLAKIKSADDFAVMELSSFQLMECQFSPNVAVITNLAENHLDWHRDMNEYLEAKKNIFLHQRPTDRVVLNLDNQYTKTLRGNGKTLWFSLNTANDIGLPKNDDTVFLAGENLYLSKDQKISVLFSEKDILLPGKHNVDNYMTAICAVLPYVSVSVMQRVAKTFGGVEHRIELVRTLHGVRYYNSSIDSSPSRSTAALSAFPEKVIMIAGGYDKHLDYTPLGKVICEHVKELILCGKTASKIRAATESALTEGETLPIYDCANLKECVDLARSHAKDGDVVILSPASASFDQFKNFEERGKTFKTLVQSLD